MTLLKLAVTDRSALIATPHERAPEQSPLQPTNLEPAAAAALSVTFVPSSYVAEHVEPQSIPLGALVTVPLPRPDRAPPRVRVTVGWGGGGLAPPVVLSNTVMEPTYPAVVTMS